MIETTPPEVQPPRPPLLKRLMAGCRRWAATAIVLAFLLFGFLALIFGPLVVRQSKVRAKVQAIEKQTQNDPRFATVKIDDWTLNLLITGHVARQADLDALQRIVNQVSESTPVSWHVNVDQHP